jgi:hypothetical protein
VTGVVAQSASGIAVEHDKAAVVAGEHVARHLRVDVDAPHRGGDHERRPVAEG